MVSSYTHASRLLPYVNFLDSIGANPDRILNGIGASRDLPEMDCQIPGQLIRNLMIEAKRREGAGLWYFAACGTEWGRRFDGLSVRESIMKLCQMYNAPSSHEWITTRLSENGIWLLYQENDLAPREENCSAQAYFCTKFVSFMQTVCRYDWEPRRVMTTYDCEDFFKSSDEFCEVECVGSQGEYGIEIPCSDIMTPNDTLGTSFNKE